MRYLHFGLIILIMTSCQKEKKAPYQIPSNIKALIAGDSSKVWKLAKRYNGKTRMNMGDCFLSYRQTFHLDGTVTDNNGDFDRCGQTFKGNWDIVKDAKGYAHIRIKSSQVSEFFGDTLGYKDFRIFYASEDRLHLSFLHNQYGNRRRISDYLVEEVVAVPDRNFHF